MTTLPNGPNTALLIVDMQNDVVKAAHARDAVIANIARRTPSEFLFTAPDFNSYVTVSSQPTSRCADTAASPPAFNPVWARRQNWRPLVNR